MRFGQIVKMATILLFIACCTYFLIIYNENRKLKVYKEEYLALKDDIDNYTKTLNIINSMKEETESKEDNINKLRSKINDLNNNIESYKNNISWLVKEVNAK